MKIYFVNKDNWSEIVRKCYTKFGRIERPTVIDIRQFIAKIRVTGLIVDAPRREHVRTMLSSEIIETVAK